MEFFDKIVLGYQNALGCQYRVLVPSSFPLGLTSPGLIRFRLCPDKVLRDGLIYRMGQVN